MMIFVTHLLTNSAGAGITTGRVGDSYDISVTSKPDLLLKTSQQRSPGNTGPNLSWDITVENRNRYRIECGYYRYPRPTWADTVRAHTVWG